MTNSYGRDQFKRADPPQIIFHVEVATGTLADALRRDQAQVVMEVLTWAASDPEQREADPRQAG
jgi:hypothetical protein